MSKKSKKAGEWVAEVMMTMHPYKKTLMSAAGVYHTGTEEFRWHEFLDDSYEEALEEDPQLLDMYMLECRELAGRLNSGEMD
ncbi:MAG: hypothetical protein C0466_15995 [Candidatus Accumulibacter sp.]|nr:hypothetical protein [Accumulibacter sp.]